MVRFFKELRRRKVIGAAAAYIIIGWPLIEGASVLEAMFELPDWFDRLVAMLVVLGFVVTVWIAWIVDLKLVSIRVTPDAPEVDSRKDASSAPALAHTAAPSLDGATASVCVLPFDDLGQSNDYVGLAEGLATEIHCTLSRMHRLRVASRRATFPFRNNNASIQDIASALNVRYVLSGSLMCWKDRIRVIAELDDVQTGSQIWSDRYERRLDDILTVQAEISEAIVSAFGVERQRDEFSQAYMKPTESLDAWSLVQRARHYILDYNQQSLDEAHRLLKKSLEVDPDYAAALAVLGSVLCERILNGFSDDIDAERQEACACVERAQRLAPHDPFVLKMTGMVAVNCGDIEGSLRALRACVDIAPYDFGAWGYFGWPLAARGQPADIKELHRIIDHLLNVAPTHPGIGYWLYHKSAASLCDGDLEAAEDYAHRALDKHSEVSWAWMHLASILGAQGKIQQARSAAADAQRINSAMTPEHYSKCLAAMAGPGGSIRARTTGLQIAGLLEV